MSEPNRRAAGESAAVTLRRIGGSAKASIIARSGRSADLKSRMLACHRVELCDGPQYRTAGEIGIIGLGPQRWLAIAGGDAAPGFVNRMSRDLHGLAAIADQTDAYLVFELAGPRARDSLAKGVALDLDPPAFGPGAAVATVAAHTSILLWQPDTRPTYRIAVPRSWARSFLEFLTASAAEFGIRVDD